MRIVNIKNEEETKLFAKELAREVIKGDIIALIGDLGTGKTTLTQYLAEFLGVKGHVKSPTFNIVLEYHSGRLPLYHFDLYRLNDSDELFNIGYEEYFFGDGVCIVEWADIAGDLIPDNSKKIYIDYGDEEGSRIYKCTF